MGFGANLGQPVSTIMRDFLFRCGGGPPSHPDRVWVSCTDGITYLAEQIAVFGATADAKAVKDILNRPNRLGAAAVDVERPSPPVNGHQHRKNCGTRQGLAQTRQRDSTIEGMISAKPNTNTCPA